MKRSIFRNSATAILITFLAVQVTLSLGEETKKRVIIKVPTQIRHIYHHHMKKIHIHKAKNIKHKPNVHVIVEEEYHPPHPKWKTRSKPSGRYENSDWEEGWESNLKPQGFRAPSNWKEEYDEEYYDNGPQGTEDMYNYDDYKKSGKKGRQEDAHFSQSGLKMKREPYSRRPRHPSEMNSRSKANQSQRSIQFRGRDSKRHGGRSGGGYKDERRRPGVNEIEKQALSERKVHPKLPKSSRWSRPISSGDEYIGEDDFVPMEQSQPKNDAQRVNYGNQNLRLPEIEKGFEPSGYSPLNVHSNPVIHSQPRFQPQRAQFSYPDSNEVHQQHSSVLEKNVSDYPFHSQPIQQHNIPRAQNLQIWPSSPTDFTPTLPTPIYIARGTLPPNNQPGFRNEIASDAQGETVGYQSHVGHNGDSVNLASSFQSVVFGQRIKPNR